MTNVERQRSHFENMSPEYLRARQHKNHLMVKHLLWQHFFSDKRYLIHNDTRVLEPMCGYAEGKTILEAHFRKRISYTGFDFSRPLVEEGVRRHPDANIFVENAIHFETVGHFDLVILIGGLHHVYAHTSNVLARISKALKAGGYFINFEPTQNNFLSRYIRDRIYRFNRIFDAETERAYDLQELNNLYRQAGLQVVDQIYPGLLSYVIYYNPDAFPKLNVGGERFVRFVFRLDKPLFRTQLARKCSFATLSLLVKK